MESALIITSAEKNFISICEMLKFHSDFEYFHASSLMEGKVNILERDFDYVIISHPLSLEKSGAETGESLARQIASSSESLVILAVRNEVYEQVSSVCEKEGIFTLPVPLNYDVFRQALSLVRSMRHRITRVKKENEDLKVKIDDIKVIDRAKNILISQYKMNEQDAHRFIEKKAMDTRRSRKETAQAIINNYED